MNIVRDCRENLKSIVRDCRNIEEHREMLMRERAELCEGLPGKVGTFQNSRKTPKNFRDGRNDNDETATVINMVDHESSFLEFLKNARQVEEIVTHEQRQVEKIVTHEQKQVEKVVTHAHRVGSVLWRHQSHVAKRRSHMSRSHMAKQFHSVQHDMRTEPHCTFDRRLECETRILNHEHVCSLSLFSKSDTVTVDLANTGWDAVETCVFEVFFFYSVMSMKLHQSNFGLL